MQRTQIALFNVYCDNKSKESVRHTYAHLNIQRGKEGSEKDKDGVSSEQFLDVGRQPRRLECWRLLWKFLRAGSRLQGGLSGEWCMAGSTANTRGTEMVQSGTRRSPDCLPGCPVSTAPTWSLPDSRRKCRDPGVHWELGRKVGHENINLWAWSSDCNAWDAVLFYFSLSGCDWKFLNWPSTASSGPNKNCQHSGPWLMKIRLGGDKRFHRRSSEP